MLGATLSVRSQNFEGQSTYSTTSKLPFSFKNAIEQIEEEILLLATEVSYGKNEVGILKSELETISDVAKSQTNDIQRYLEKEIIILKDVIDKQHVRQNAEFARLSDQVEQVHTIKDELEQSRMACVVRLIKVQDNLGVETDPNEAFLQPLA